MEVYIATTRKPPDPYIGPTLKILDTYTCIAAKCADTREIAHQYEVVGESSYPFNGSISVDFIRNSYAVY